MDPPTSPSPSLVRYSDRPTENTQPEKDEAPTSHGVPKDWKFWCIIFSLSLSILLTAVEFVSCFLGQLESNQCWYWETWSLIRCVAYLDLNRSRTSDDHTRPGGQAIHLGRFCVCARVDGPSSPLWRPHTGATFHCLVREIFGRV
jgi:hypothetical protein